MISKADVNFIRLKLLPWSGLKAVRLAYSRSKKRWPDIWIEFKDSVPVITVTREWMRQDVHERRKRLTHEFCHLLGLSHPKGGSVRIGKYIYSTFPGDDSYSKLIYEKLIRK